MRTRAVIVEVYDSDDLDNVTARVEEKLNEALAEIRAKRQSIVQIMVTPLTTTSTDIPSGDYRETHYIQRAILYTIVHSS